MTIYKCILVDVILHRKFVIYLLTFIDWDCKNSLYEKIIQSISGCALLVKK